MVSFSHCWQWSHSSFIITSHAIIESRFNLMRLAMQSDQITRAGVREIRSRPSKTSSTSWAIWGCAYSETPAYSVSVVRSRFVRTVAGGGGWGSECALRPTVLSHLLSLISLRFYGFINGFIKRCAVNEARVSKSKLRHTAERIIFFPSPLTEDRLHLSLFQLPSRR